MVCRCVYRWLIFTPSVLAGGQLHALMPLGCFVLDRKAPVLNPVQCAMGEVVQSPRSPMLT